MFTRIQTRNYRCLRAIDQPLARFQALVGPNASGKTTFLDVFAFLGDLVRNGGNVFETVLSRSSVFEDLLWMGKGRGFELAVEAKIPDDVHGRMSEKMQRFQFCRYEIGIEINESGEVGLRRENL